MQANEWRDYSGLINRAQGAKDQIQKSIRQNVKAKKEADERLKNFEKAQAFLQQVAQDTQEQLRVHVEDIVQLALDAIFPDQYQFEIRFAIAYGKTTAELCFISKITGYSIDPMVASGGGVVDVCSFALRLACWTLSRGIDSVMIFDEPMKHLSADMRDRAATIMRELAQKLNLQFIMVTHMPELEAAADKVIRIKKGKDGISYIA